MLTEEKARKRHESRKSYVAIVGEAERPTHLVSLAGPWVTVSFLDDLRREVQNYDFHERRQGELFLNMAVHRRFRGDSNDLVESVLFSFKEDGKILIETRDDSVISQRRVVADPSVNWERYPAFGVYDDLCRYEREPPLTSV